MWDAGDWLYANKNSLGDLSVIADPKSKFYDVNLNARESWNFGGPGGYSSLIFKDGLNVSELVDTGAVDAANFKKIQAGLAEADELSDNRVDATFAARKALKAEGYAGGGGVDTVPAMLTPGEFVMSKSAVGKYGKSFMAGLNRGQVQGFNRGGQVQYLRNGGSPFGRLGVGLTGSAQGGIAGLDDEERKARLRRHFATKKEPQVGPKIEKDDAYWEERKKKLNDIQKRKQERAKDRADQRAKFQGFKSADDKKKVFSQRSKQGRMRSGFARRQRSGSRVAQRLNRRAMQRGAVTPQMQQQVQQQQQMQQMQQRSPMQQVRGGMQQTMRGMQRMAPGGGGMRSGGGGGGGMGMQPQGMEQAFQPVMAGMQAAGAGIAEQIGQAFMPVQQIFVGFTQSLGQTLAAGNFDQFIQGITAAATGLDKAAQAFNGMTMTHNISFEGPLTLNGIDVPGFAAAISESLGNYVKGIVEEKLNGPTNKVSGNKQP